MKRAILMAAVAMFTAACGGTANDPACPHPDASVAGTWTISLDGQCDGGVLTIAEVPADYCGAELSGTWTCGAISGTLCPVYSFRSDDYAQITLCSEAGPRVYFSGRFADQADGVWQLGSPPNMLEGAASISRAAP